MLIITFHTNLDNVQKYVYGIKTDRVPNIGERLEIFFDQINPRKSFELEVVAVRNIVQIFNDKKVSSISVELSIPSTWKNKTFNEWEDYFRKHVEGKRAVDE